MDALPPEQLQEQLARLGDGLAVRRSVTHYAVGFGCAMVGIMSFGVSMRLLVESEKLPVVLFGVLSGLALACVAAALGAFIRGRRLQLEERERFAQYLALRAKAGLD
jgi:NAD/NADP transhydrogenase alpha subunit